jgi:hypothetical protein
MGRRKAMQSVKQFVHQKAMRSATELRLLGPRMVLPRHLKVLVFVQTFSVR